MAQLEPFFLQAVGQNIGQAMDAAGDALQALWPVEHRVQAGDICQQYLGSTNIGVRFLATDMLFAGLHRHTQRGVTGGIFDTPIIRPGIERLNSSFAAKKAACGPP
jgi:hypothetical protein